MARWCMQPNLDGPVRSSTSTMRIISKVLLRDFQCERSRVSIHPRIETFTKPIIRRSKCTCRCSWTEQWLARSRFYQDLRPVEEIRPGVWGAVALGFAILLLALLVIAQAGSVLI